MRDPGLPLQETTRTSEGDRTIMFKATARLKIRDGELENFKLQVAEIMRLTREKETKPLRYDWFLSEDGTECEVREAYADADALLGYQRQIAEPKMRLMRDFVEGHTMTFYGEPSPALAAALESMGVQFTVFSLLQDLDADIRVAQGVPA
jgi:quinol monooxygenase YgiN